MRPIQYNLPSDIQSLTIAPKHKVLLDHVFVGDKCYVILLTDMPGDCDKVWELSRKEYWGIQSLHESRDRWVRNRIKPTISGDYNPKKEEQKFQQLSLF